MSYRRLLGCTALTLAIFTAAPAAAQTSEDIGISILQLLVDEGVVPRDKAQDILAKARAAAKAKSADQAAATASSTIDVPYVPQTIRDQLKSEVKAEILAEATTKGLVAPGVLPDWVGRIRISGDFRARNETQNFSNDNFPFFPDIAAINAQGGVANAAGFPLLNSTVNRNRTQFRARLGFDATIADNVRVGFRLASGDDGGAVSTDSTFGNFFDRGPLWIDRAYVQLTPLKGIDLIAGRMPNPFYSTDLAWDPDINPEGAAISVHQGIGGYTVFATAAALPLNERERNSDTTLFAGQLGFAAGDDGAQGFRAKVAGAYYYYKGIQSRKNAPDGSRLNDFTVPPYLSKGNSVFNVRTDGLTTLAGLGSKYEIAALTGEVAYTKGPTTYRLSGEVVRNFGVDETEIAALRGEPGVEPGDFGWQVRLDVGRPIAKAGDWRVAAAYKYIETDAVLDIFTDSEFGLGGTDQKGYILEGEFGVFKNTGIGLRYLSTDAISRPPFSIDVLQITLNTRF